MMKIVVNRIVIALLVFAMTGVMALAKQKSDQVTFSRDLTINGKVVKKGTYKIMYDDQTNELSIIDKKETVAKSAVHTENRNRKPSKTEVNFTMKDSNVSVLNSVTFAGDSQTLILEGGEQAANPQQ